MNNSKIFVSIFFVMIMLAAGCQAAGPSSPAATSRPTAELAAAGATPGAPAGEARPSPSPTEMMTPTATPLPTSTPAPTATATPTVTPTPIPTLPPEQVGGLSGVPDPRYSDPDLFDLTDPDAPIPQFVHAFTEAGINIQGENIANNLEFTTFEDRNANPIVVATTKINVFLGEYEDLNGSYPLFIATENEKGEWMWLQERHIPLRFFADQNNVKISNLESHYDRSLKNEVLKDFNSWLITWYQKWDLIQPRQNQEEYNQLDHYVDIASRNDIESLGGPVIYFLEYPDWIKDNLSSEELEQAIRNRVRHLIGRYSGDINYWIVVNEYHATPNEPDYLYQRLGYRYVEIAFDEARKANPDAVLIYNDNTNESPKGRWFQQTYNLVKQLKERGLIDGVGMQMHLNQPNWTGVPSKEEFMEAIRAFHRLGLEVYITEMDVALSGHPGEDRFLYQAHIYYTIIKTYLKGTKEQRAQIINFFGLRDNESWYNEVLNVPNAVPLLFDNDGYPKLAYYAILKLLYENFQ